MSPTYTIDYLVCEECNGARCVGDVGVLATHLCRCEEIAKEMTYVPAAAMVVHTTQALAKKRRGLVSVIKEDAQKASLNLSLKLWFGTGNLMRNIAVGAKTLAVGVVKGLFWWVKHPPVMILDLLSILAIPTVMGVIFTIWYHSEGRNRWAPRDALIENWEDFVWSIKDKTISYVQSVKDRSDEEI